MNKIGLILIIIVLVGAGILMLKGNKNANKNMPVTSAPTANQTAGTQRVAETTVTVTGSGYAPQTLTVKIGTKVVWVNKSGDLVTVNSDQHPTHFVYPPLNLGQFADGSTVSLVFGKPGTFKYHNHLNASETGTITVE